MRRGGRTLPGALVLLALVLASPAPAGPARNVVLITVDSLRPDHLPHHGYPRATAPFLASLASEAGATVFDGAIAAATACGPGHTAILTGFFAHQVGAPYGSEDLVLRLPDLDDADERERLLAFQERLARTPPSLVRKKIASVDAWLRLPGGTPTLAAFLRDHGYRTGGFVSHWSLAGRHGHGAGFEIYDDAFTEVHRPAELSPLLTTFEALAWRPAAATMQGALAFLDGGDAPFFLFVHLADTHLPYRRDEGRPFPETDEQKAAVESIWQARYSPRGYFRAARRMEGRFLEQYDRGIRQTDQLLESLFRALDSQGLRDDTLVILTSDHGESFGERGDVGHAYQVWEEDLRIPLLLLSPAGGEARRREDTVSQVDVVPTVLAALGFSRSDYAEDLPGRDLAAPPGEDEVRRVHFVSHGTGGPGIFRDSLLAPPTFVGFREGSLKFWMDGERFRDEDSGRAVLFQLASDPTEERDISGSEIYRPHVDRYRVELREWYLAPTGPGP